MPKNKFLKTDPIFQFGSVFLGIGCMNTTILVAERQRFLEKRVTVTVPFTSFGRIEAN
ncbi:MAG: hypothetical protein MR704_12390 [Clostridia bacterium]|nr:hypothetical protein [Anaerovorax odorimutans]MCI7302517.1 hypothetical protein [Clostridia bacterium]